MKKMLGAMVFLWFLGQPLYSFGLTLSEIRTAVRLAVKDSDSTRRRYTDANLNALINEAHRQVIDVTWAVKKSTSVELAIGTTHYTLPTDTIHLQRVTWRHKNLRETSLEQLDNRFTDTDWANSKGDPDKYYQDPARPNQISIYPWPSASTSTGTLRINYFAEANTLSSDSDEPFNNDSRYQAYHDLLIFYPVYRIYKIEGELDKAQSYKNLFDEYLILAITKIGANPNYRPSFGAVRQ